MTRPLTLAALILLVLSVKPDAAQKIGGGASELVGTWTLVSIERPAGAGTLTPVPQVRGLLIFDAAGHVFEAVTVPRPPRDASGAQLGERQQAFASFGGFWGRYTADARQKRITYQAAGAVSPNLQGRELARAFDVAGDTATFTASAAEPHAPAGTRWVWERVPTVENLSPGYRQVIGFWQHVVERRINLTTKATQETRRAPSVIVYSPSGYVGVHFPPLNRQTFAGDSPTEDEARAALAGYVGYFGALTVYPGQVFHHPLGSSGLAVGNTLKRFFEISGDEVTIRFPIATNNQGQQTTTTVTLKRLSGAAEMLPPGRE